MASSGVPDARRTNGCAGSAPRAGDRGHAPGHRHGGWARSPANPAPGPTAARGAEHDNRSQPSRSPGSWDREEEPVHEPSLSQKLLEIEGLAATQHRVDGATQAGRQDAQRLLLAVLLLAALLPALDGRAAADQQTDRLG